MNYAIRTEQPTDFRAVEELTRDAFWNLHVPGCDEHFLAHKLRINYAFIPQLDLVAVQEDGTPVGNIMYTRSAVEDDKGVRHETVTFGPLSVSPQLQKQGIGAALIEQSRKIAAEMGFAAIIILGNPKYYGRFGFRTAKEFGITMADGSYSPAHMVLELYEGALSGISGSFEEAPVFEINNAEAEAFDKSFPPREKFRTISQREFEILSTQRI